MKYLAMIKEYIDAKADYDRSDVIEERVELRYRAALAAFNEAIQEEEWKFPE